MKHISSFYKNILLGLVLLTSTAAHLFAQQRITAIDILLDPDQTMLDSAKAYNALMRMNYDGAGSFELDATHNPHITILQCFVKSSDLDKVYKAVSGVVKKQQPAKEELTAIGFYYIPVGGLGLAGITAGTKPGLLRFQANLIEVLKPFIVTGTDAAFIQNANGSAIAAGTTDYVNGFIPDHSGSKYNPHVTIGLAKADFLDTLVARPFHRFVFKSSSVSIYQLGDFGTAQVKLWQSSKN